MDADGIRQVVEELRTQGFAIPALRKGNAQVRISCPMAPYTTTHKHPIDQNPGMSIKVATDGTSVAMCWTCGWKGTLSKLLWDLNRANPKADLAILMGDIAATEDAAWYAAKERGTPAEFKLTPRVIDEAELAPYANSVPRYALERGLTLETCKAWGLGHDKHNKRLLFPVRDWGGRLFGATGRTVLKDGQPKYHARYFGQGLPREALLYGEHMIDSSVRRLIVVEGPLDAILVWQNGFRNVVSILGCKMSDAHVDRILNMCETCYLAFDNDPAGEEGSRRAEGLLRGRVRLYTLRPSIAKILEGTGRKDPGDMTREEFQLALDSAEFVL